MVTEEEQRNQPREVVVSGITPHQIKMYQLYRRIKYSKRSTNKKKYSYWNSKYRNYKSCNSNNNNNKGKTVNIKLIILRILIIQLLLQELEGLLILKILLMSLNNQKITKWHSLIQDIKEQKHILISTLNR